MKYCQFMLIFFILIFGILGESFDLHFKYAPSNKFNAAFNDGNDQFDNSGLNGRGELEAAIILTEFNQDIYIEIPDGTVYFKNIFDECTWRKIIVTIKSVEKRQYEGKGKYGESSSYVPMADEDVIQVNVQGATKNCPIKVIGANRWLPPSPTTMPSTPKISIKPAPPPSTSSGSSVADSNNEAIWTFAGVLCGILLLSIGIRFGYRMYRTRNRRKGGKRYGRKIKAIPPKNIFQTSTPVLKQKLSKVVTKEPTKAETEKTKISIIKSAKVKTNDKTVAVTEVSSMLEMTTQEEVQNDSSIQSPSNNTISEEAEPVERNLQPLPSLFSSTISSSSPEATKNETPKSSQHTDETATYVPSNFKKDKIEAHYASLLRSKYLGNHNSLKAREMRRRYPRNSARQLHYREVKLFSSTIGEMFIEVNKMCHDAESELKRYGVEFDEKKGFTKMTGAARKFIEDSKTANFIAYFAFGAEYHEFLDSDVQEFPKFSVPLLFAISMIPRFDEQKRRKALSWIRRQISIIRESFSADERDEMAFPVNAFEQAYEMSHQKRIESLDELKTMCQQLLEDKIQRDCHEAAKNRVAGRRDGTRKRKNLKVL